MIHGVRVFGFLVLLALASLPTARAGGGAERLLLVVNEDSPLSLEVASAYVRLRNVPASHVCYLRGVPRLDVITADQFRERIWAPIRAHLEKEGLASVIHMITYSADFPYGVDFRADLEADKTSRDIPENLRKFATASLTGFTYLAHRVEKKDTFYQTLFVNRYFRRPPGDGNYGRMSREEQQLHSEALTHVRERRYAASLPVFEKLFARYDGDWQTWLAWALALAEEKQADRARVAIHEAVRRGLVEPDRLSRDAFQPILSRNDFAPIREEMEIARKRGAPPALGFVPGPAGSVHRYYLSTVLTYTGIRGLSGPETLAALARSAATDGTRPDGTVYLMVNKDIRSKTRQKAFPATVQALRALGRKAEILEAGRDGQDGKLPCGKNDVVGAVVGTAGFQWNKAKSTMLPGAIVEHLTSFGAFFRTAGQTKAVEFLRHGAAGTSGTVVEPFALQPKFPHPFLHVYYAEGCSLAEAFYQSVQGPYQLLVMGDPLTRPFARFAEVALDEPAGPAPWKGQVEVRARVKPGQGAPVGALELWVDGRLVASGPPEHALTFDTRSGPDGWREVRLVAVARNRIQTRSECVVGVRVANAGRQVSLPPRPVRTSLDQTVRLRGQAPGAREVEIRQGARVVATAPVQGGRFTAVFPARALGVGEVRLQARARYAEGPEAWSEPRAVQVAVPAPKPVKLDSGTRLPGLAAEVVDAKGKTRNVLLATLDEDRGRSVERDLRQLGVKAARRVRVSGEFQVKTAGLHQLVVSSRGRLRLQVDGREVLPATLVKPERMVYAPMALAEGWHALEVELEPEGAPSLQVWRNGADVAEPLAGRNVRHPESRLRPVARAPKAIGDKDQPLASLTDGKQKGAAVSLSGTGVTLVWKQPERNLGAVVLYPAAGTKESPAWPGAWRVEARRGSGPWRPVKDLEQAVLQPVVRGKGKHPVPELVRLTFKPTTVQALRVAPVDAAVNGKSGKNGKNEKNEKKTAAPFSLTEIEAYRRR